MVEFEDESVLLSVGSSNFQAPGVEPTASAGSVVHQGYREAANVPAVEELVRMITTTRLYQANVKSAMEADEQLKSLLQVAYGS